MDLVKRTNRNWLVLFFVALSVTPFWRGGRDGLGPLITSACLFLALLLWTKHQQKMKPIPRYVLLPLSLFASWVVVSYFWASDSYTAGLKVIALLLASLVFVFARQVSTSELWRSRLVSFVIWLSVPLMIFGVYLYYDLPFDRASSFFYAPNSYALYLLIVWLLALFRFRKNQSLLYLILMTLVASQLFLSQSIVTIFIAALAASAVVVLTNTNRKILFRAIAAIGIGIVIAVSMVQIKNAVGIENEGTPDEIGELIEVKTGGLDKRLSYWGAAAEIYSDNFAFGVGLDGFQTVYPQYQEDPSVAVDNPHNFYLQITSETGIAGLTLMLWLLAGLGLFWWKHKLKPESDVYFIILTAMLLHAGFYETWRYPALIYLFALILGLWLANSVKTRQVEVKRVFNTGLVVGALVLSTVSGFHFISRSFADQGLAEYNDRQVVDAIVSLEESVDSPFHDPDVQRVLSIAQTFSGDFDKAVANARESIEADPDDGKHYGALAFALQQSGAPSKEVKENYERNLELNPHNSIEEITNYVRYLFTQSDIERAGEVMNQVLPFYSDEILNKTEGSPDLRQRVGLLHFQRARYNSITGNLTGERADLERTLELYPSYALAQSILDDLDRP